MDHFESITASKLAMLPGFENLHPLINPEQGDGMLSSLYELQQALGEESGYASISYSSAGFDTGLFSVIAMIKAWQQRQLKTAKSEFVLIGDATQFEFVTRQIEFDLIVPPQAITSVDRAWLRLNCGDNTAVVFLFPPEDVSMSIDDVGWIADRVHYCGGLIVADSGVSRSIKQSGMVADGIVDLYLLDLYQLFGIREATTTAGCFALAAGEQLSPYLPLPRLISEDSLVRWENDDKHPLSIGRTGAFGASQFALLTLAIQLQLQYSSA